MIDETMTWFSRVSGAFVLCVALVLGASRADADTIKEIVVVENSKTTDDTVRYIAGIDEGDEWNDGIQAAVNTDMVTSGLFKDVSVYSEPHPKGGVKVTIIAHDKHSWVVAPAFYNQPTNRGAGIGFGENNLFGENKKLLLYGQIATGDSFFIAAYIDPSIAATRFHWALDVYLKNERIIEYSQPTAYLARDAGDIKAVRESKLRYLNSGVKVGFNLFRSLSIDGRVRGARVNYLDEASVLSEGAVAADVDPALDPALMPGDNVPNPGKEGWDVSAEAILKFDRRANWYGITSGNKYQLAYEVGLPGLGSDFDYWYATANYERARRYLDTHNLIIKLLAGYGENVPFQQERSSGGTALRGYKNSQFRGDIKGGINLEYSAQLFNISGFALRTLVFGDVKYTAFLNHEKNDMEAVRNYLPRTGTKGLAPLKSSVGVGTRVYLRQIVLPLLGLDVGYGLEGGGIEVYFAIGITDF